MDEQKKIDHLYACWCAKEAVYKCYGQKEISFSDNIDLEQFPYTPEGNIQATLRNEAINAAFDYRVDYFRYEDYMVGYVKG